MTFCNKGKLKVRIANLNDVKKFKHMAAILQNYSYSSTNLTRQLHEANVVFFFGGGGGVNPSSDLLIEKC